MTHSRAEGPRPYAGPTCTRDQEAVGLADSLHYKVSLKLKLFYVDAVYFLYNPSGELLDCIRIIDCMFFAYLCICIFIISSSSCGKNLKVSIICSPSLF